MAKLLTVINDLLSACTSDRVRAEVIASNMEASVLQCEDLSNEIFDRLLTEENRVVANVPIQCNGALINPNELLLKIDFTEDNYMDKVYQVNNYNTGENINVTINDVVNSISDTKKNAQLCATIYAAAASGTSYSSINPNVYSQVSDILGPSTNAIDIQNIVNQLCDSNLDISSRVQIADSITGFNDIIINDNYDPLTTTCVVSNYTGIKPYSAMLNALKIDIDFPEFKVNSLNDAVNAVIDTHLWVYSLKKDIVKATGRLIKRGFQWLVKKTKDIYVNPTDYTIDGDWFSYSRDVINFPMENQGYGLNFSNVTQYFTERTSGTQFIFDLFGIEYSVGQSMISGDGGKRLPVVSRRVKIMDIPSVRESINDNTNFYINPSTGYITGINSIDDVIAFSSIAFGDYPVHKSATEESVYAYIFNSITCSELMLTLICRLIQIYKNSGNIEWDNVIGKDNIIAAFNSAFEALFYPEFAGVPQNITTIDGRGYVQNIALPSYAVKGQVSNLDMIEVLSFTMKLTNNLNDYLPAYNCIEWVSATSSEYQNIGFVCGSWVAPIHLFLHYLNDIFNDDYDGGIFLPYCHTGNANNNWSINTDKANINYAIKTTLALVTIATVALVSIKILPKIVAFRKDLKLKAMSMNNLTYSAGEKYIAGDIDGAMADFNKAKKYRRLTNMFGVSDPFDSSGDFLMLNQIMGKIA